MLVRSLALAGLAAAAAVVAVPQARAQDAAPTTGCAGVTFSDRAGDAMLDPTGSGLLPLLPARPNLDLVRGWFTDPGGAPTFHLQVAELDRIAPPTSPSGLWYYVEFRADGVTRYVRAAVPADGDPTFRHGVLDDATGLYTDRGETTGALAEGPGGVITMALPPSLTAAGAVLREVRAHADTILGADDQAGLSSRADEAPDDGAAPASHTVGACVDGHPQPAGPADPPATPAGPPAPPPGSPTGPAEPAPAPSSPPSPGSSPPAPRPSPAGTPPPLRLRAPARTRTARRGARLVLRVATAEPVEDLRLELRRRSRRGAVVALGGRRRVDGTATVGLRVVRRIARGPHVLVGTGIVDGEQRRVVRRLRAGS